MTLPRNILKLARAFITRGFDAFVAWFGRAKTWQVVELPVPSSARERQSCGKAWLFKGSGECDGSVAREMTKL